MSTATLRARGALVLVLFATLSACASFPGEKLKGAKLPDSASYAYRPSAYVDVKFFQGNPGSSTAVEIPGVKPQVQAAVDKVLKASSPFSNWSFDVFEQEKMDYAVKLHYYNHGDVGASMAGGFITGFTMFIIPSAATDNYTVVSSVNAKGKAAEGEYRSSDLVKTWLGIWFLPVSGKTPQKAITATFEDLARDALRQVVESGQVRFTAPAPEAAAVTTPAAPSQQ